MGKQSAPPPSSATPMPGQEHQQLPQSVIDQMRKVDPNWQPSQAQRLPDYMLAAQNQGASGQQNVGSQTQANRPDQTNAFGSNVNWTKDANGNWHQSQSFGGPLGGAAGDLEQQAAAAYGKPFDLSGLPALDSGADARKQAIDFAYNQSTSRLDPQWNQRQEQLQTQLANQGLDSTSSAYTKAMDDFSRQRNDAYQSAMSGAVGQGTSAGAQMFGQSMAGRQQALAELLKGRELPMQDLESLRGLLGMQQFNAAGVAPATPYLAAMDAQGNYALGQATQANQTSADILGGAAKVGAAAAAASDERLKEDVERLPVEADRGIPMATWRWKGDKSRRKHLGVIAQDVERVRPDAVVTGPDGFKRVKYGQLPAFSF